jgi:hypothetical protein
MVKSLFSDKSMNYRHRPILNQRRLKESRAFDNGSVSEPPQGGCVHTIWFSLSDPAMEEALHDIPLHREFALLDAGMTRPPDESTILRFRHPLEAHELSASMQATVNEILQAKGLMLKVGSAVDATLIAAPNSTKNPGTRDPGGCQRTCRVTSCGLL